MILVTGATGTVGSEVTRLLLAAGQKVRVLIRSPEKAEALKRQGAEVALGDLGKGDSLREALHGVQKAFLLSAMSPRMAEHEITFINAAREAGVKHVVLLSTAGAGFDPGLKLGKLHRAGELALEASGMAWTVLRPNSFMTNFFGNLATVKGQNTIYTATGPSQFVPIDPRDIAECAVKALTTPGHENKTYVLTGPQLESDVTMAKKMGDAIGKALNVVEVPIEAARQGMMGAGFPEWLAHSLSEFLMPGIKEQAGERTEHVQQILGRPARSFDTWVKEFGPAFK